MDEQGCAVQLMRSWVTAMPGEFLSCVGCHENPGEIAPTTLALAAGKQPGKLDPWYGEIRGFDFQREVQPVLDKYCISCHDGSGNGLVDLRSEEHFPDYRGKLLSNLGHARLHPEILKKTGGYQQYTPSYDVLIHYIRRVSIEDEVNMLTPGEYHAGTSPLVQMLQKGHHGVELDQESWERLFTWIDLNGPCHGTWNDVFEVQDGVCERRKQLAAMYGAPPVDPEYIPPPAGIGLPDQKMPGLNGPPGANVDQWSHSDEEAWKTREVTGRKEVRISLEHGIDLLLVKIPAGSYMPGDTTGPPDEWPHKAVSIEQPFWMAAFEITNQQYRLFHPAHSSRYYGKRHILPHDRGIDLDGDTQPVVRVSFNEAIAYCQWLTRQTGIEFHLPTEEQWEYACRAGSRDQLHFGSILDDFAPWANLGDRSFGPRLFKSGGVTHMVLDGAALADTTWNDHHQVTAPVGSFMPNPWGLYDMHGNVAEWVIPGSAVHGSGEEGAQVNAIARGGSFYDPPKRARSASRTAYPAWQKVFNTGFRVVAEIN
jgi:formylglycine-generating enzyme required for sulfatase activity